MRFFLIFCSFLLSTQTGPSSAPRHLAPRSAAQPTLFERLYLDYGCDLVDAGNDCEITWRDHISRSYALISDAARRTRHKRRAVILGAGTGVEIPVAALADTFEEVLAVDLDESALASLQQRHPRVQTLKGDLTGGAILELLRLLQGWIAGGIGMPEADRRLAEALLRMNPPAVFFGDADLVVSSAVVCQIQTFLFNGIDKLLRRHYGLPHIPCIDAAKDKVKKILRRHHLETLLRHLAPGGTAYLSYTWPHRHKYLKEDVDEFDSYPFGSTTDPEFQRLIPDYFEDKRQETWDWPFGNPETGPIHVFKVRGMVLRPAAAENTAVEHSV